MSTIKHRGQRVGVFIDTQNLYHCAKNLYQSRVNFGAIVKDAVGDRTLVRAVAYLVTTESGEEKNFLEALGKMGIEIGDLVAIDKFIMYVTSQEGAKEKTLSIGKIGEK
jgi:hypothetical protein